MNEITGPVKIAWSGVGDVYQIVDANGNEINEDQINALLARCDSLMAIAMAAKELADMERIDGLARFKKYIILKQNVQQLISAHEQKYGPIDAGGE